MQKGSRRRQSLYMLVIVCLVSILSACNAAGGQGSVPAQGTTSRSLTPTPIIPQIMPSCAGASCTVTSTVPQGRPFIDTRNNIHLFLSFDYHVFDPAAIAKYYDFVWGADVNKVAAYRATNPNILLSYYISFFRDSGAFGNTAAHQSLAYWQAVHPDWVLYRCDRQTPAYEDNQDNVIPFDFTNPAVVQWQVQTYAQPASQQGYDAIAADNVNLQNLIGACGFYRNGQWVQRYTGDVDDPQWRADVLTWTTRMQQALHALPHPMALIPNLGIGGISLTDPTLQQIVAHVDAVVDESGFTHYGQNYVTDTSWVKYVHFIERVQQQHKAYYIVNEFSDFPLTSADIEWALASYLMSNQDIAAVFFSSMQQYGGNIYTPALSVQLGSPRDNMYQGQSVYWRDFTHAISIVNPSSSTSYTVNLHGHYTDLNGNAFGTTVTLPPHSGQILLY